MKKVSHLIVLLIVALLTSCETVVGVDLNEAKPKLVVDASINWVKGSAGNEQLIKLTTTTGYFSETIPNVSGAVVSIKNSAGTNFSFLETPNTGEYVCSTFIPELGEIYNLTILYNGQTLTATEIMIAVPEIDRIEQEISPGIGNAQNHINIKTFFTDPGNSNDFYMTRVQTDINAIPEYYVTNDEFFQGNQIFDLYMNQYLKAGDTVAVKLFGISERYYNYMAILTSIAGNSSGPFSTPPATLRGNVVNNTNPDNFILGYFSLNEVDEALYVVQ